MGLKSLLGVSEEPLCAPGDLGCETDPDVNCSTDSLILIFCEESGLAF